MPPPSATHTERHSLQTLENSLTKFPKIPAGLKLYQPENISIIRSFLFLFTTRKPNSRVRRKTIQRIPTIELPLKVTDIYHLKPHTTNTAHQGCNKKSHQATLQQQTKPITSQNPTTEIPATHSIPLLSNLRNSKLKKEYHTNINTDHLVIKIKTKNTNHSRKDNTL